MADDESVEGLSPDVLRKVSADFRRKYTPKSCGHDPLDLRDQDGRVHCGKCHALVKGIVRPSR